MDKPTRRTTEQIRALFTPALPVEGPDDPLAPLTIAANALLSASMGDATIDGYTSDWRQWERFCIDHGFCDLPAEPHQVALFLAVSGAEVNDGAIAMDAGGNPRPGPVRPNTVAHRLTAINKAHHIAGHREPGDDQTVSAVLRGLRRSFGSAPLLGKAALDIELLERLLAVVDARPFQQRRDLAIVLVDELEVTPGQMARLAWADVDFGAGSTILEFASPTVSTSTVSFEVVERVGDDACLVTALRSLRELCPDATYVFEDVATGKAFTRQGLAAAVRRLTGACDLDEVGLRRTVKALCAPTLRQLRDRALLLTGWYAALRRSNLVWMLWSDLRLEERDWELTLRRTKTNIDGAKDQRNWLNMSRHDWPCPATAMSAWRDGIAAALGVGADELGDRPVFVQIDRYGNIACDVNGNPEPLSGDAVCDLIKDLAKAAGLTAERFGAHSLRAGFITEALTDDKASIAEVQDVTHHVDINVLADYRRLVNARRSNATQRLFTRPKPDRVDAQPALSPQEVLRRRQQRSG